MEKKRSLLSLRYLLPALLFITLAVFLLLGLGRNPNEIPSPLINKPAPAYRLAWLTGTPPPAFGALPPAIATGTTTQTVHDSPAPNSAEAKPGEAAKPAPGQRLSQPSPSLPGHQEASAPGIPDASSVPHANDQLDAQALRGAPYLLNVWASWCAPCLQEHPQMLALAKTRDIRLVGLNYKDQASDARRWLHRHGNPFDMIVVDPKGRTAIDFGVYGVPETFLIDAHGQIRFKHVGPLTDEVLQQKLLPAIAAVKEVSR
ncbi:MAG: DsbE family thiol:disulfide interchange protein [Lautropia sp.]|nr:DsbE family thiol:disulfide interchange protein [Lautropia sp.]